MAAFVLDLGHFDNKVGDAAAVPVSFRYNVAPSPNMVTSIFKPNPLEDGTSEVGKHLLGAHYHGSYQKCPRNQNVSVVWEARHAKIGVIGCCHCQM